MVYGRNLVADYHYIFIKDDYSNLEEKLNFYINNEEASKIIKNAHAFVSQFKDEKKEDLFLVGMEKYFKNTPTI